MFVFVDYWAEIVILEAYSSDRFSPCSWLAHRHTVSVGVLGEKAVRAYTDTCSSILITVGSVGERAGSYTGF